MKFRQFMEAKDKPLVSFDFDGTLHRSIVPGTTHPIDFFRWKTWEPNQAIHDQLRKDAANHKIIVVSRRDDIHKAPMWKFIQAYNLPVEEIYTTNGQPKGEYLVDFGVIKHYDDDINLANELHGTGIEFVHVNPFE